MCRKVLVSEKGFISENDFGSIALRTHLPTLCGRKLCDDLIYSILNKLTVFLIITDRFVEKENLTFAVLNLKKPGHLSLIGAHTIDALSGAQYQSLRSLYVIQTLLNLVLQPDNKLLSMCPT